MSEERTIMECWEKVRDGHLWVTPQKAESIINQCGFDGQRRIAGHHVALLAGIMENGGWVANDQLTFCELPTGKQILVNGYHRMHAIKKANRKIAFSVRVIPCKDMGEVRNVYCSFDTTTRKRTDTEIVCAENITKTYNLSNRMATAIFKAAPLIAKKFRYVNYQNSPEIRDIQYKFQEAKDVWEAGERYEMLLCEADEYTKNRLRRAGFVGVALVTIKYQPDMASAFWQGVASLRTLEDGDPRLTLGKAVRNPKKKYDFRVAEGEVPEAARDAAMAWNAFFERRELRIFRDATPFKILGTPWGRSV